MNYKSLIFPLSVLVLVFGVGILICAVIDRLYSSDAWPIFSVIGLIVVVVGGTFSIYSEFEAKEDSIGSQEGYFLIVVVWVIFPVISALPFLGLGYSFTDSMFESVSGLTTTGATIVTELDSTPVGLLLWRAVLQWVGGLALIITAVVVLPSLGVAGMEVFHFDSTESTVKFTKNSEQTAYLLMGIYLALSILCTILYWANGMSLFDAVAHSMTTVSAGGFSTTDTSFIERNDQILIVSMVFMILVGLPFMLFKPLAQMILELSIKTQLAFESGYRSLRNRLVMIKVFVSRYSSDRKKEKSLDRLNENQPKTYRKNSRQEERDSIRKKLKKVLKDTYAEVSKSQIRVYLSIILLSIVVITIFGLFQGELRTDLQTRVLHTVFNVASVLTGTGYASADYNGWGSGVMAWFILLMFCGGCAGSATCGMRVFRLQIAFSAANSYCKKMVSPHRVSQNTYDGKRTEQSTLQGVMVFLFLYVTTFLVSAALLSLTGLDPTTSISAAAASVSNVGPGFGETIGPTGTYHPLSDIGKWICLVTMLLGRLEFVAIFVVLTPRFWTS